MEAGATPGPMRLLLVEAFAGTHPVGRVVKDINSFGPNGAIKVAAYLCMEMSTGGSELCENLGLHPDFCLKCHGKQGGDVGSPEVQRKAMDFVRKHLANGAIDAVIVFGGPPCTEYSNAKVSRDAKTRVETAAAQDYIKAIEAHAKARLAATQALQQLERSNPEVTDALRQLNIAEGAVFELHDQDTVTAAAREAAAMAAWEKAAAEASAQATRDYATILEADATVKRFLNLYKRIEAECKVYREASQGVACYLVMENPYSTAERALWNRPFMKPHLINLPNKPRADMIEHNPEEGAWLHSYYQDWCAYFNDVTEHPKKPTIIFSNLPNLTDMSCRHTEGTHPQVVNQSGPGERAKWPLPFVKKMLEAVVQEVKPELLPQAKLVLGLSDPAIPEAAANEPATTEATTAAQNAAGLPRPPAGRNLNLPPPEDPPSDPIPEVAAVEPAAIEATTAATTAAPGAAVAPQVAAPQEQAAAANTVNPLASLSIVELLKLVADLRSERPTQVQLRQATAALAELSKRQDSQWQQLQLANTEPGLMPGVSSGLVKLLGNAGSLRKEQASVVIKMLAKGKSDAVVDNLLAPQHTIVRLLVGWLTPPTESSKVVIKAAAALAALAACSHHAQTVVGNTGALAANLKKLLQHEVAQSGVQIVDQELANINFLSTATAAAEAIKALTDNHHIENINRFKQIGVTELLQQLYARPELPESVNPTRAQQRAAEAAKAAARDALNSLGVQPFRITTSST